MQILPPKEFSKKVDLTQHMKNCELNPDNAIKPKANGTVVFGGIVFKNYDIFVYYLKCQTDLRNDLKNIILHLSREKQMKIIPMLINSEFLLDDHEDILTSSIDSAKEKPMLFEYILLNYEIMRIICEPSNNDTEKNLDTITKEIQASPYFISELKNVRINLARQSKKLHVPPGIKTQ